MKKKFQGSFYLDKVRGRVNMIVLEELFKEWSYLFPEANTRKMFTLITTRVFGAPGERIISGATNAVSKQLKTVTALELLELKLLKQRQT